MHARLKHNTAMRAAPVEVLEVVLVPVLMPHRQRHHHHQPMQPSSLLQCGQARPFAESSTQHVRGRVYRTRSSQSTPRLHLPRLLQPPLPCRRAGKSICQSHRSDLTMPTHTLKNACGSDLQLGLVLPSLCRSETCTPSSKYVVSWSGVWLQTSH